MPAQYRRRDPRVRVSVEAEWVRRYDGEPLGIVEASNRGLRLHARSPLPLNELMKLKVTLPTGTIVVHAVAIRRFQIGGAFEVGCRFFALAGPEREMWERFVASQSAPQGVAA